MTYLGILKINTLFCFVYIAISAKSEVFKPYKVSKPYKDNGRTIQRDASYSVLTIHFHFTKFVVGELRISIRVGRMSSVVVVDDVSSMVTARYVHMIRYRNTSVVFVMKAQYTVLFVCCVRQVN